MSTRTPFPLEKVVVVVECPMAQIKEEITPEARKLIKSLVQKARENPFYSFRQSVKGVFGLAVMTGKIPGNILEKLVKRIDKMLRI